MFDLGFSELFLIALVALVVLGPQRLPKAARFAGVWIQRARAQWQSVKSEFENQLADEELKGSLRATRDELDDVKKQLKERGESLRSEFELGDPAERDRAEREQAELDLDHRLGSSSDPDLDPEYGPEWNAAHEPGSEPSTPEEPGPEEPERRESGTPEPVRRDPPPGGPRDPAPDKQLEDAMIDRAEPVAPDRHDHDRR